jgi:hypothetical protein
MIRIINPSGLGNRIKGTVSALRIADNIKDTVHNYDYPNDEIFTFEQTEHKTKEEVTICQTWQLEIFDDDSDNLKNKNIFLSVCGEGGIHFLNEGSIDFQYFNISDKMILEYLKYFNKIKFNSELLQQSNKFCSDNDIENCIGVHIRTWGDDLYRNNKLFDIQDYILEMNKYENNFFVCADDDSVIQKLISIYGDRIVTASNFNINNKHIRYSEKYHEALYAATLDLLCYSECKCYIGTYQSTFSEVAWWLSGAKKSITIPVPKFVKYYRDNYENNT